MRRSRRASARATALAMFAAVILALPAAPVASVAAGPITPSPTLTQVDVGGRSTCAVVADGTVRCWGANVAGLLGNGSLLNSIVPVTVSGITTAVRVSVGGVSACAVLASGSVKCWGKGAYGTLGNGHTADALTPVTVANISTAVDVTVGSTHACARLASGKLRCWGSNGRGQLGDGTTTTRLTPITVSGITTATDASAGSSFTCARLASGSLRCWGDNRNGTLGDGTYTTRRLPTAVVGITDAVDVSAGMVQACATLSTGGIRCWGYSMEGLLGNGSDDETSKVPVPVTGISTGVAVEAGSYQTCARLADGTGACWGSAQLGGLGDGTTEAVSLVPVAVSSLTTITQLSSGSGTTCALLEDATASCWGSNRDGEMGNRTVSASKTPVPVSWEPDTTRPTAVAPIVGVFPAGAVPQSTVRASVYWNASDGAGGTGIDHYQVQKSRDGGVTWSTVPVTKSRTYTASLSPTGTVRYRVRAWDRAGNLSAWATGLSYSPRLVQQTSSLVTWTGTWTTASNTDYLGGSTRYTTAAGASATYRFTGWSVGFVSAESSIRGSIEVWVDGSLVTTVDLGQPEARRRLAVWSAEWPVRGTHTLKLVAVGDGRVDLDAIEVVK